MSLLIKEKHLQCLLDQMSFQFIYNIKLSCLLWNSENHEQQTEIFMGCYCIARKKAKSGCEKTKPQMVMVISCSFEVWFHDLNFTVIGQYTIDMSETN